MKKLSITILLTICIVSTYAQKVTYGSFSTLANQKTVSISIDYSESKIDKVPFEVFLDSEDNWEKGYREILMKFVKGANQSGDGMMFLTKTTDNCKLIFKAIKVDNDGETSGSLVLLDKDNNIIAIADGFNANGGKFGSQMNLMGDAAERLGKKVGKFIKSAIR